MALTIRKGATKAYLIGLENCTSEDYIWDMFDKTVVRLQQGTYFIDKDLTILSEDHTAGLVHFTEAETLPLNPDRKAQLQLASTKESRTHELVIKSRVFDISVLPSLWDTPVATGTTTENLDLIDPVIPVPALHSVYDTLHIDIKEYSGIISERDDAIIEGDTLVYDQSTETLFSE